MTNVYVLIYLDTEERYYYKTIAALCKANSHDKIRVTGNHLYEVISKNGYYENNYVRIEKVQALSSSDIPD